MKKNTQFVMRVNEQKKEEVNKALREEGMTFTGFVRKMMKKYFHINI